MLAEGKAQAERMISSNALRWKYAWSACGAMRSVWLEEGKKGEKNRQ